MCDGMGWFSLQCGGTSDVHRVSVSFSITNLFLEVLQIFTIKRDGSSRKQPVPYVRAIIIGPQLLKIRRLTCIFSFLHPLFD